MHQDFLAYSRKHIHYFFIKVLKITFVVFFFLLGSSKVFAQKNTEKPFVVVLDAGHGGHDSGNRGNGYFEKKIALNIVLKIGKKLEKQKGIKVIYTRKTDVFVELIQRANIANKADADLFVSVHCDAFTSPKAFGAGTFVLGLHANDRNFKVAQKENAVIFLEDDYEQNYDGFNPNDPESVISLILMQETYLDQSIDAAGAIQKSFVSNLNRKDRTVKQAGFVVLKYTYMPSVLVETGFLTNKSEGAFLNSSKGQSNMSNAIAKAIINYKNIREAGVQELVSYEVSQEVKSDKKYDFGDITFKVQIAASKRNLKIKPYNFKGLRQISKLKKASLYRYFYEKTTNYKDAQRFLKEVKKKGYSNAFIVAFNGDKKITISEALRLKK
jgi:N-acetylmuramoyl-L-alanine amidase|tara:strand:- start:1152 stop:2303 length:1152 start_codon:yes stop_codon:yes gene_type:complete